jgi:hypothetical protein
MIREPRILEIFYFNYAMSRAFGTEPKDMAEFFGEYADAFEARFLRELRLIA